MAIDAPITFQRRGVELRAVLETDGQPTAQRDERLIRTVAQGHAWFRMLRTGAAPTITALADRLNAPANIVARQIEYAVLAPDIVEAILAGRQPVDLTADALRRIGPIPEDWAAQRRLLGFPHP